MSPELAKRIAFGDACPVSRLPMEDINPSYTPLALKPLNNSNDYNRSAKAKGKMPEKAKSESILNFFGSSTSMHETPPIPALSRHLSLPTSALVVIFVGVMVVFVVRLLA